LKRSFGPAERSDYGFLRSVFAPENCVDFRYEVLWKKPAGSVLI
jgi:hypothetical protein